MSKFKPEVHITILECSTIVYTFKLCCLKKVILNEGKGRMLKTAFRRGSNDFLFAKLKSIISVFLSFDISAVIETTAKCFHFFLKYLLSLASLAAMIFIILFDFLASDPLPLLGEGSLFWDNTPFPLGKLKIPDTHFVSVWQEHV